MEFIQYPQMTDGPAIAAQIVALEHTAWPSDDADEAFPSAPETYLTSFVLLENGRAIGHVGIRKCEFVHRGHAYLGCGLSEVVVHPDWRKQGIGARLIQKAADCILSEAPDVSIFTCAPKLVNFYTSGGWHALPNACLVGGTKVHPFRSDSLGLVTMARIISERAIAHESDFETGDIVLELGENQLW